MVHDFSKQTGLPNILHSVRSEILKKSWTKEKHEDSWEKHTFGEMLILHVAMDSNNVTKHSDADLVTSGIDLSAIKVSAISNARHSSLMSACGVDAY